MLAIILVACHKNDEQSALGSDSYQKPDYTGLPPSEDTAHNDDRSEADPFTGDSGSLTEYSVPEVMFGMIGWYPDGTGVLTLTQGFDHCMFRFSEGAGLPAGYRLNLYPTEQNMPESLVGTYATCGAPPCFSGLLAWDGAVQEVLGSVTVSSVASHWVPVSWELGESVGSITVFSCGDVTAWE